MSATTSQRDRFHDLPPLHVPGGVTGLAKVAIPRRYIVLGAVLVAAIVAEELIAAFISTKGVGVTGDEPSYIVQAQALSHGSAHILPTVKSDLASRLFSSSQAVPVGIADPYRGPHGVVASFDPGLSLLLVPFISIFGPLLGAVLAIGSVCNAGLIYIHQRLSAMLHLGRWEQLILGVSMATPALLLAETQIYPDLPAGILVTCALVEIGSMELLGSSTRPRTLVFGLAIAILPWLQPKNLLPALVLLVGTVVLLRRRGSVREGVAVFLGAMLSWALLAVYNQYFFGHILGLPEPGPRVTAKGLEYCLGLLFDRHQGLFVQFPFCFVGILGLWIGRRRMSVAAGCSILTLLAIVILNGSYTGNPYGGLSLAGRFMWTVVPVLLLWVAVVLSCWQARRGLLVLLGCLIGLSVVQAIPIVAGQHYYYNAWDMVHRSWPSWWPGIAPILPQFGRHDPVYGAPAYGLAYEVLIGVLLIGGLAGIVDPSRLAGRRGPAESGVAVAGTGNRPGPPQLDPTEGRTPVPVAVPAIRSGDHDAEETAP